MTSESKAIVAVVDRFPHFIRERFLNSVNSLAEVYRLTVLETPLERVRDVDPAEDAAPTSSNVIQFRQRA